jgi:hypothetical protein
MAILTVPRVLLMASGMAMAVKADAFICKSSLFNPILNFSGANIFFSRLHRKHRFFLEIVHREDFFSPDTE